MISLKNVTCSLGGQVVLNSVNLTVKPGEAVLLTGANGSGKTTLLRLLNGLVFPVSGEYRFQGELITASALRRHRLAKAFHQRLGYVWQNPDAQLFCASVAEELAFGPWQMGLTAAEVQQRADDALAMFALEKLRDKPPYALSGGEKRRVALAAIFTMNPVAWTLDEPESYLDAPGRRQLAAFLQELQAAGKTLIIATHHPELFAELDGCELQLADGHIAAGRFATDWEIF